MRTRRRGACVRGWRACGWRGSLTLVLVVGGACADDTGAGADSERDPPSTGTPPTTGAAPTSSGTQGGLDTGTGSGTGRGETWTVTHAVDEDVGRFLSVWGSSTQNLYVVGGQLDPGADLNVGALARNDGRLWSAAALPADVPTLNWVFGIEERRVMVGDVGTVLWRDGDDGPWLEGSCGTVLPLWGVWGAATDDLWVVGGDGFNRDPVLCHFDGTDWAQVAIPEASFDTFALFKVWGSGADDVFAVGDNGWIIHFDGTQWQEQASGTEADLISLWGAGPDEILAVGGRSTATLARWNGRVWASSSLEGVSGLNGVWMDVQGDAVVGGAFGLLGRVDAGTMTLVVQNSGTPLGLHAVFGLTAELAEGPLWAVGGSLEMPPPYIGTVLRWPQ